MATGGVFQLITNDGKQDRMLMATALLNKRLIDIERARSRDPTIKDPTPTLADIERTHVLFVNAHFKPFAAMGYEYNRVATQSGTARLGSEVQFSIPQYGDLFNDMALHVTLGSVTAMNAAYWTNPVANPAIGQELLTYVQRPGQALINNVRFDVNGNPLDQYNTEVMNFHQKYYVNPNKIVGWNRNMGQEMPNPGVLYPNNANGRFGRGAGVRQSVGILNGYQTPQVVQPAMDLWIPLLFWFNKDPRLSIPSVSIPYGQRYIYVGFNPAAALLQHQHAYNPALDAPGSNPVPVPDITTCELYINNIFVNPEIHDIFIKRIGFSLVRVYRQQPFRVYKNMDNLLLNNLKWPVESIYFGMRPIANIDQQSNLMLVAWDQYCQVTSNSLEVCSLQNSYLFATGLPANNITAADYTSNFTATTGAGLNFVNALNALGGATVVPGDILTVTQVNAALTTNGYPPLIGTFANPSTPTSAEITAALPSSQCVATYYTQAPTLTRITVEAQGVPLYPDIPAQFFNSYMSYTYGGLNINTPEDVGAESLYFCLYPGSYQPSGHVNVSRAREFYLNYNSNYASQNTGADMIVMAVCINFLLISDGSAVLRYST